MLVDTLTEAFFADPVMSWLIPDPLRRPHLLRAAFEIVVDVYRRHDELYTTGPTPAAGAVWAPPGCQPTGQEADDFGARCLEAAEETAERLITLMTMMDEQHPAEPHDYLFFLGARPQWQSLGLGSALLREVLDRCDREGRPAYLEASSIDNQRLYLRHGFKVTGEIVLPDGPSLWPMWRAPGRNAGFSGETPPATGSRDT
jgi:GNAT superfamily N-acetyltransferase